MIGAVVLAAGGSRRLGQPKQLLRFRGKTLLGLTVDALSDAGCRPVVVVLGAHAQAVAAALEDRSVDSVHNLRWSAGMAGSIRSGIRRIAADDSVRGALLAGCDQPLMDAELIRSLVAAFEDRPGCRVCAAYGGSPGIPAIFHRSLFPELLALQGDRGAKQLLLDGGDATRRVVWEAGQVDIDRPEDLEALERRGGEGRIAEL